MARKKTSSKIASIAAKLLQNPTTPKGVKKVAASDLSQREKGGRRKR
jgi:hypothetical protein